MPRLKVARVLPYRPEQLFDIAADVERYPDFLLWWRSAKIRQHAGNVYYTEQVVGFGPFTQQFSTKTTLRRPREIEVNSVDGPFEIFQLTWRFGLLRQEHCQIALDGQIELRTPLLRNLLGRAIAGGAGSILSAFEDRAQRLYGSATR